MLATVRLNPNEGMRSLCSSVAKDAVVLEVSMYAVVVPLKVKPEMREKFLAAALDDSTCSVRDEPGCLRFDVLQDNSDPNRFFFYEVYKDEDAFKAHQASAHYPRWRAAAAEVLAEPTNASRCTTVYPKDYK